MIMSITAVARSLPIPIWRGRERRELIEGTVGVSAMYRTRKERERERKKKGKESCCYTYVPRLSRTEGLKEEEKKFSFIVEHTQCHLTEGAREKKLGLPSSN